MFSRANPNPCAPKSGPGLSATRPRSRNARAGSASRPSARQSSQARKLASGGRYRTPGRCSASSPLSSERFSSSWPSSASSQDSDSAKAATAASTPIWPASSASQRSLSSAACPADPATATAHFSPGMFHALEADVKVTERVVIS
jgi:hypothetical protein